jgi:hypothetical protein
VRSDEKSRERGSATRSVGTRTIPCCDYCDRFHADGFAIVDRGDRVVGYACMYCTFTRQDSIRRRKEEGAARQRGPLPK